MNVKEMTTRELTMIIQDATKELRTRKDRNWYPNETERDIIESHNLINARRGHFLGTNYVYDFDDKDNGKHCEVRIHKDYDKGGTYTIIKYECESSIDKLVSFANTMVTKLKYIEQVIGRYEFIDLRKGGIQ